VKKRGLGKGLDALFPTDFNSERVLEVSPSGAREIRIELIRVDPAQPRQHFDQDKLAELAASIKQHGIIQPLILTEKDGMYLIIAGERRYRAAKLAGLERVPAVLRTADELQRLEMALVENVQREDLNPIEQALSIRRLQDEFSQSLDAIARRLGKATSTISNTARLLGLPEQHREAIAQGILNEGGARQILALGEHPAEQDELFLGLTKQHWTTRKAEQFVKAVKEHRSAKTIPRDRIGNETDATRQLGQKMGRSVTIQRLARGGRLQISFRDDEDLAALLGLL
jgi:ParB family chromosome partitioning protein